MTQAGLYPMFRGIQMAAAKCQQENGAKKCENGRPRTVSNRPLKKCAKRAKKRAQTVENKRKQAKMCENDRDALGDRHYKNNPRRSTFFVDLRGFCVL